MLNKIFNKTSSVLRLYAKSSYHNIFWTYIPRNTYTTISEVKNSIACLIDEPNTSLNAKFLESYKKTIDFAYSESYSKDQELLRDLSNSVFSSTKLLLRNKELDFEVLKFISADVLPFLEKIGLNKKEKAILLNCLGQEYLNKEKFDEGLMLLMDSLKLYEGSIEELNEEIDTYDYIDLLKILLDYSKTDIYSKIENTVQILEKNSKHTNLISELKILLSNSKSLQNKISLLLEALSLKRKIFGEKNLELISLLSNIGDCYAQQNNETQSIKFYKEAKEIILSNDNASFYEDYTSLLKKIVEIMRNQSKFSEANDYCNSQLEKVSDMKGYDLFMVALNNQIGANYLCLGDINNSKNSFKTSIDIIESSQKNSLESIFSYSSLGTIFCQEGDMPNAMKNFQKSLDILKELKLFDHQYYASTLGNIGLIHNLNGDWSLSLDYFNDSASILEEKFSNSLELAECYLNIGRVYVQLRKEMTAIEFLEKALNLAKINCGELSSLYADILFEIGLAKSNLKNKESEKIGLLALEIYKKLPEYTDVNILPALSTLGKIFINTENFESANIYLTKAAKVFHENSKYIAPIEIGYLRFYLGLIQLNNKKFDQAINLFDDSVAILSKIFGEDKPQIAQILERKAEALELNKNLESALAFHKKVYDIRSEYFENENLDLIFSKSKVEELEKLSKSK